MTTRTAVIACMLAMTTNAWAHGYTSDALTIAHPYALPTPPGATTGAAYLKQIDVKGNASDALIGASSPAADRVEMHDMRMDGDVMRMRAVRSIAIDPGKPVTMAPGGGYHLMLIGIHRPLAIGNDIPLTLQFEHAGKVDVVLHVQERGTMPTEPGMSR